MHPEDSLRKRKEKTETEFKRFLEDEFEDPKNSDVLIEKQDKPNDKDPKKRPRA